MIMRRVAMTNWIVSSVEIISVSCKLTAQWNVRHCCSARICELGFRSQVHGTVKMDIAEHVDHRQLRFMGEGAAYAVLAMEQAIANSGLDDSDVSNVRTGLIAGSGRPSTANLLAAFV